MTNPEIIPPPDKPKRPVDFTDDIFQDICDRMAEGEGLREICADPQMPSKTTFLRWVEKDTGRQRQYASAREALMDHYAEEIRTIAWDDSQDTIKREGKPDLCNHEWINRSRLKVDTLKFLMSKLHPRRYGDNAQLAPPASEPSQITLVRWMVAPVHDDDGNIIHANDGEKLLIRIRELEARLGHQAGKPPPPPSQITYQPEPLPNDLSQEDWSLLTEVLNLIRRTIPTGSNAAPDRIFSVLRQALLMHFREVEIENHDATAN